LYNRGKEAFRDGHYEVSESQFQELLEKFPRTSSREEVVLLLAQSHYHLGRWEEACTLLKNQLEAAKPPAKFAEGYAFWLAEALSKGKKYPEAEQRYRSLLTQFPTGKYAPQAQYGLAWVLYQTKRAEEALKLFEDLASSKGRNLQEIAQNARVAMGEVLLATGQHDKAREVFAPIAEKTPPGKFAFEARYWLGHSAYDRKQHDEALAHFQRITTQTKVWPSWVVGESWSSIGWIYWNQGEYERSADAFDHAMKTLESEAKRRESAIQYGQCYLRMGKIEQAIEKLREFVRTNPTDPLAADAQSAIADIFLSQNQFEDAAREYALIFANFPNHDAVASAHYWRGWALFELKRYQDSIAEFQQAAEKIGDESQAAEAMYKIGDAYWKLDQHQNAIAAYEALLARYPDNPRAEEALFQVLQAQLHLKNTTPARNTLAKLVEKFPESRYRDESHLQIGLELVKQGFYTAARELYQEFLNAYPSSPLVPRALLDLGQSHYLEGSYAEAREQFEKVLGAEPPPAKEVLAVAKYRHGLCLYQTGQPEQAVKEFTELVEKYKGVSVTPEVQFRIGEFFFNQKNYAEAQRQFELLQANYPTSAYADSALYWAGRSAYAQQGYKAANKLFQTLLDNYMTSQWRPDARFWQGDALIEQQHGDEGYANALLVFDQLIRDFPDSDLVDEARGRKGDCQFTLKRYQEAIVSYQSVVDSRTANVTQKNHARYQIGRCYEALGRIAEAFEQYMIILYDQVPSADNKPIPESLWFCRAGMAAAAIKKQQDQWREAMNIYKRIVEGNVSCSQEAQDQVRAIENRIVPTPGL